MVVFGQGRSPSMRTGIRGSPPMNIRSGMRTDKTGIQMVNPLKASKMKNAAVMRSMNIRICVQCSSLINPHTSNKESPTRESRNREHQEPTDQRKESGSEEERMPQSSVFENETSKPEPMSSMRNGGFARYGSLDNMYGSDVNNNPSVQNTNPESNITIGTDTEVHANEARSGQGRASIRGSVGMKKMPNGQMK